MLSTAIYSIVPWLLMFGCTSMVKCNTEPPSPDECTRTCEWPPKPRACVYKWVVESSFASGTVCSIGCPGSNVSNPNNVRCHQHPDCILLNGVPRPILVVNKLLPGPSIQVCEGDTIIVHVTNNIEHADSEGLTIHWHGIHQFGTPHMDGVLMITQCPILIHQTFTYVFDAYPAGTHWWHAHSGLQRVDGVYGSFVIREPTNVIQNTKLYDYDLPEHVIMVHDWFNKPAIVTLSEYLHNDGHLGSHTILINGKGARYYDENREMLYSERAVFNVVKGRRYRFRIISSTDGRLLTLSINNHVLRLIATEGGPLEPFDTASFVIHSAERFDFVLEATQEVGNYWFRAQASTDCVGCTEIYGLGIIHYEGAPEENPTDDDDDDDDEHLHTDTNETRTFNICEVNAEGNTRLVELTSAGPDLTPQEADVTFYISSQQQNPPSLAQTFNNISFYMPPSPLTHQSQYIPADDFCYYGEYPVNCLQQACSCINTLRVKTNQVIELVLVNEGPTHACHPLHIHGHIFHLVAQDSMPNGTTIQEIKELDRKGLILRKLTSSPVKDTVFTPLQGYTIVRFVANNPGWWFFHCHMEWHLAMGMALVLKVGTDEEIPPAPVGFPQCGSWTQQDNSFAGVAAIQTNETTTVDDNSIPAYISSSTTIVILIGLLVVLSGVVLALSVKLYIVKTKYGQRDTISSHATDRTYLFLDKAHET